MTTVAIPQTPPAPRPMAPAIAGRRAVAARASADFTLYDITVGTAVMSAVLLVNKFGLAGNIAFFVIIFAMLVRSPLNAYRALTLGLLALCTNNALVVKTVLWAFARFGLVVGASGRFFLLDLTAGRRSLMHDGRYVCLCLFCGVASLTSLMAGNRPDLALMKVFSFWFGLSGLFAATEVLRVTRQDVTAWTVKLIATTQVMCVLSLVLGIGQNYKHKAFAGKLFNLGFYHSQTLGPISAIMFLFLACVLLFTGYRNRWICLPLMASLLYGLYMSGSRTGVVALVVGLSLICGLALVWSQHRMFRLRLNFSRGTIVAMVIAGVIGVVFLDVGLGGRISRSAINFMAKSGREVETVTFNQTLSSRKGLIDRAMANFWKSPLYGHGFQLYADREANYDRTFLSAQVEKGFLPAAVLEETGVLGAFFLIVLCVSFLRHYYQTRNVPGLAMFVAFLVVNLGECIFFSLGGHGAFVWSFVMAGDLLGDRCRIAVAPRVVPLPGVPRPDLSSAVPA